MAKSASTDRRTALIKYQLKAGQGHSFTKGTYIDDGDNEVDFLNLKYPINIKKRGKPPKYANTNYNPAAAEVKFSIINKGGIYSPKNIASGLSGIFVKDRVFKFYDGKRLGELSSTLDSVSFPLSTSYFFFTQYNSSTGKITLDEANSAGNADVFFLRIYLTLIMIQKLMTIAPILLLVILFLRLIDSLVISKDGIR